MGADGRQADNMLVPIEQDTILFYGHPLVAVRLADGRICAVLRWLCEGLHLQANAQLERIKRKTALTDGLVYARVETSGGPQVMPALTLRVLPGWFSTIDESRVKEDTRAEVIVFQRECTDVLAKHFADKARAALPAPSALVPAEPMTQPAPPPSSATPAEWREWRQAMRVWLDWQDEMDRRREQSERRQDLLETRQDTLEGRLEGVEELSRLFVEVTERLGPQTLSPEHQATVKALATRPHQLSGLAYSTIYGDLNATFHVASTATSPRPSGSASPNGSGYGSWALKSDRASN